MILGCGFDAIDIRRKLGDVAVHLKDSLLRPKKFDQYRIVCLDPFADETVNRREKQIFRHLLRDRARSAHRAFRIALMSSLRILDLFPIKPVMLKEPLIFSGNDSFIETRRDVDEVFV